MWWRGSARSFFLFFNAVVPEWIDVVVPGWCGGVRRARTWPQGHSRLPQNVSTVDTNHQSSHRQGVRSNHDVHTYSCPLPTAGEKLCRCPPVLMFSTGVLSPARITTTKQVSLAASHGFFNSPLPPPRLPPPLSPSSVVVVAPVDRYAFEIFLLYEFIFLTFSYTSCLHQHSFFFRIFARLFIFCARMRGQTSSCLNTLAYTAVGHPTCQ